MRIFIARRMLEFVSSFFEGTKDVRVVGLLLGGRRVAFDNLARWARIVLAWI
jgi:hypothetical protein